MPVWTAAFITGLRERVTTALAGLDTALVNGTAGGVAITIRRGEPWISVPKLTALPEPGNQAAVMLALHLLQPALVHVTPCSCKPSWIHRRFTTGWMPTSGAG